MKSAIIAEIRDSGPMPFERFMMQALYGPVGGFFASDTLRSQKAGDFLTSPEVSAAFGETLGRLVEREYHRLGSPDDFALVEHGAGSGSLMAPLLETLAFVVELTLVEASPAARVALRDRFPRATVVTPESAPAGPTAGVILANELLDNLPMALAVRTESGWSERWVSTEGESLVLVEAAARPTVLEWVERYAGPVDVGGIVEVQLEAADWLRRRLESTGAGAVVVIDYGDTADLLAPRRAHGTLRTYRAHHLGPHPLDEPGATDITADVNFSALQAVAAEAGWQVTFMRQDDFLTELGARERLADVRTRELESARSGDTMERLRLRNEVTEIETILHPRGLGDFRVLVARRP